MVCVPCIVIPVVLWIFHKFIQPFILKYWNPWKKSIAEKYPECKEPPKDVADENTEFQFIKKKVNNHAVMLFSKTSCKYCSMAKRVLDDIGVEYVVEELNLRDDCSELQDMLEKITGERSVPRVFVNGRCIGGGSETWSLHNQGHLIPMLKEAGAQFMRLEEKKVL